MAYEFILTSVEDGILTITLNREKQLNALNAKLIQEVGAAIETVRGDKSVIGVILTGIGRKAFAAGADIKEFSAFGLEEGKNLAVSGGNVFNSIEQFNKPVIAAVNGFALGGGCELTMACHMRVASDNAKFGQPEVNLGLIPGYAGTQRLVQLIGKGKAIELLLTGDMIGAEEAHRLGLVNHVTTQDELLGKCASILKKIGKKGPLAVDKVIDSVNAYYDKNRNGFDAEIDNFAYLFNTKDFTEGTTAFMEKRKADFKGE
ncbi:UNVERIFIED_CONTAM: hypothetical protein GTU68_008419 [Idotea baltica]|nr:hypothetical protein [Idotea baltica]